MQPLRDLIRPNQKCYWDDNLNKLFESSNQIIIDLVKEGVQSFDLTRQTCMEPDWSVDGVGYFLLQKHCDCSKNSLVCCKEGWRQIFAGSRFTKPTERNCWTTEGEVLALSYSLHHSRLFTLGCSDLFVATDHKPLLGIFNNRDLGSIDNPRIQPLKESTLPWCFDIIHCPGKWTRRPDALSRYPGKIYSSLTVIREQPGEFDSSTCSLVENAPEISSIPATNEMGCATINHINTVAQSDPQYQDLLKTIKSGFQVKPNQTEPCHLREFW